MDDTRPSGGTALGFVKRMGDAAFKMDGHSMGLGLFLVFNLRKMHGRATSFISAVKVVFDPRKKINGGKTLESGRSTRGLASGQSRRLGWRSDSRLPRSFGARSRRGTASSAPTSAARRNDVGLLRD